MKKKFLSILLSATLIITGNSFAATAYAESADDLTVPAEKVVINSDSNSIEDTIGLNTVLNYFPEIQTYGSFSGSDYILNRDTLTSDDAVDFYPFTLTGTRTVLLTLQTTADYIAIICPYDPTTGDITVSTAYPNVRKGETAAFGDVNYNDQNTFCLVVLNLGSDYGAYYTVAMNAQNKGYATAIVNVTDNFRYVTLGYESGEYTMNGVNILDKVNYYVTNNIPGVNDDIDTVFEYDFTIQNTGVYRRCQVHVKTCQAYLNMDGLTYGTYTNSSTAMPISSNAAVFIPIYGGRYTCILTASPSRTDYGAPTGYLVYDLKSNKIIDWASDRNFFYSPLTDMYTFEMQQLVSL